MLLALSAVVLTSYVFDLVGKRIRVPSVIFLIMTGIALRFGLDVFGWELEFMDLILPVLGTLGLVLIVLEGSLELKLNNETKTRMPVAGGLALIGVIGTGGLIASAIHFFLDAGWWQAWIIATPFAVISSAVAIPAASFLNPSEREIVVYESALSDIFGVMLFYALLDSAGSIPNILLKVTGGITASTLIGFLIGLAILVLIGKISAHVRFVPMIFGLVFVYAASKLGHLVPLISVLAVGLLINNAELLNRNKKLYRLLPKNLDDEVAYFKQLTLELTFIVRTFFFLLLGYTTSLKSLAEPIAWEFAVVTLALVFLVRKLLLRLFVGPDSNGLIWFAPRGLITVLLFLNIPEEVLLPIFPDGTLMLVVLLSVGIMAIGSVGGFRRMRESEDRQDRN